MRQFIINLNSTSARTADSDTVLTANAVINQFYLRDSPIVYWILRRVCWQFKLK